MDNRENFADGSSNQLASFSHVVSISYALLFSVFSAVAKHQDSVMSHDYEDICS